MPCMKYSSPSEQIVLFLLDIAVCSRSHSLRYRFYVKCSVHIISLIHNSVQNEVSAMVYLTLTAWKIKIIHRFVNIA